MLILRGCIRAEMLIILDGGWGGGCDVCSAICNSGTDLALTSGPRKPLMESEVNEY
jgi:hypothetical protein